MKWIKFSDKEPSLGQFILVLRTPWPAFYWMGEYTGTPIEEEDMFSYWMEIPKPPKD